MLSATHNIALLGNMRTRTDMGARPLLVDVWMDANRSSPPAAPLMSVEFLIISGEGQAYAETETDEWLAQIGWRKLGLKPLVGPSSVIIAEAVGAVRLVRGFRLTDSGSLP